MFYKNLYIINKKDHPQKVVKSNFFFALYTTLRYLARRIISAIGRTIYYREIGAIQETGRWLRISTIHLDRRLPARGWSTKG